MKGSGGVTLLLVMVSILVIGCGSTARSPVETELRMILNGERAIESLTVAYSDLHPLHGGLALTIQGNGEVEQEAVRFAAGEPHSLSQKQVRALVEMLVELEAWRQVTPERQPLPDESRATLRIAVGDEESEIWEWYNELESNGRMIRVLREMQALAWNTEP